MSGQDAVEKLVRYGFLVREPNGSLRALSEEEKREQAVKFFEAIAGEPFPEGLDPLSVLEELEPGFSEFRRGWEDKILDEIQQEQGKCSDQG